MDGTDEAVELRPEVPSLESADVARLLEALQDYLQEAVPHVLGCHSPGELRDVIREDDASVATLRKFVEDSQQLTLMVYRHIPQAVVEVDGEKPAEPDDEEEGVPHLKPFSVSLEAAFTHKRLAGMAMIKRTPNMVVDKPIPEQFRIVSFNEGQPFEALHAIIHNAVNPYMSAAIQAQRAGDKIGIKDMKRALADLELFLIHLQQDIDIPEVHLVAHPLVKQAITKAEEQGRKADVQDFADKLEDVRFLNQLQQCVVRWIREAQKVTRLNRDPSSGTAMQEISFWLNLETALVAVKEKIESPEVALTLEILRQGRRFGATLSFDADTNIGPSLEMVHGYNQLMKDFPLNKLLGAQDTDTIRHALFDIFTHLKKVRNAKYPIPRALKLLQAISRDLNDQMVKVLASQGLMHVSYSEFDRIYAGCKKVFAIWEEEHEKFRSSLRQINQGKREDQIKAFRRIVPEHNGLKLRLESLAAFRKQHDQLRTVIARVLRPSGDDAEMISADDVSAIEEVNLAYDDVKEIDALDLSQQGQQHWDAARKRYDERIDNVETTITSKLRDQLGTAKSAHEMFRIFSKFNALFVRPRIRGAIREYQSQLIRRVKQDIDDLHEKFKVQYNHTVAAKMSEVRDLPPISGQIIWARQIDRQLTAYMERVQDVLGKGWESHVEGRQLAEEGANFRRKLDTQALFDKWAADVQSRQLGANGRIFEIEVKRGAAGSELQLQVNFRSQVITLSKEVRNLKWLGFRVPLIIVNKALQANHLYPCAISLKASIRTYAQTMQKLKGRESILPLVANYRRDIQVRISEGVTLRWESYRLESFVQAMAEEVFIFQDKVDELIEATERIDELVASLSSCKLDRAALTDTLTKIQKIVDGLNLHSFVNLPSWVEQLDARVEAKLLVLLNQALVSWSLALQHYGKPLSSWDHEDAGVSVEDLPRIQQIHHELVIRNSVMSMTPPKQHARENLLQQLQRHVAIITELPRVSSAGYQVGAEEDELAKSQQTYRALLTKLPNGGDSLINVYKCIESVVEQVGKYVNVWLQYQALWDTQASAIVDILGDDLAKWNQLLMEIRRARRTFETAETHKQFGPVRVDFAQVQTRVSMKYDVLHKDLLAKFGNKLKDEMATFYAAVSKARTNLEALAIESASTEEAVSAITTVQELKRKLRHWDHEMDAFRSGEKLLERQRFRFPDEWMYVDHVHGEWSAFNEILSRRDLAIQTQMGQIQIKVVESGRDVDRRLSELLADWDKRKPVGGDVDADEATNTLAYFEGRFNRLKDDYDNIVKAKTALDLDFRVDTRLETCIEELHDLKSSWAELSRVWSNLNDLRALPWNTVQPRKIRSALDDLIGQLKNMPPRVRSYASYEHTMETVKGYKQINKIVIELKSEALKERHWKQLFRELKVKWVLSDLTLGQVWDADLGSGGKELIVQEVMSVAQGEMGLEEYLKQVKEEWGAFELELVNYQNKTRLIRGWDDLFNKCREHLNGLAAMKLSPYFKVFEDEANAWNDKLTRVNNLFDVWIDVQRRWVYLEGIFSGSQDIKTLLASQTTQFQSISQEFLALMKRVVKSPMVLEVVNIPNGQRSLERLADLLSKIQKALGEFLARQRAEFPRFYFVGDEDLLEIIGNSKNVERLQKHFKKMFAGINLIRPTEDFAQCTGIESREGEEVAFHSPVQLKDEKINTWLTNIEKEMRVTLARLLADCTVAVDKFRTEGFHLERYLAWMDKYQAQLVVLAAQVAWSTACEHALGKVQSGSSDELASVVKSVENTLSGLADTVLLHQPPIRRRKLEHLITELVHQRDVLRHLISHKVASTHDFGWLSLMRFYFDPKTDNVLQQLTIKMADATFHYGFEYLGLTDKLVQTPLTDRCYLTMTQALQARQGGSPFGPAGTGKTESVKSLGCQLGRFVLVFNCDETFDAHAMTRIFIGLCQVGAWGCFDEFNRLEERQLSAVSQQIQTIQTVLKEGPPRPGEPMTCLLGDPPRSIPVSPAMAIFITMNPGYAGRSNLPDNLKKLFRNLAMTKPDRQLIAQVMLYSQGFRSAEVLSKKVVPLYVLCDEQLSDQSHYDFGLRALKAVLVSAGNIKREHLAKARQAKIDAGEQLDEEAIAAAVDEQQVLIQSITQTMMPKLVSDDIPLLKSLLADVFPGVESIPLELEGLRKHIEDICVERHCVPDEKFIEKCLQLYQVTLINHGLMLVGPSGAGKSTAWRILLEALERWENVEGVSYVIDPKAISKEELYGSLDSTTREWSDGLFTHVIRKIVDNVRGELQKRQWIIFDGDVDPEWVENLNSVLDDNKLLTLPNGERLNLPPNVRIIFEVEDLKNATLATVSRCGMVWFSEDVLSLDMLFQNYLRKLRSSPMDADEVGRHFSSGSDAAVPLLQVQKDVADALEPHFSADGLVAQTLQFAESLDHVMVFTNMRAVNSLCAMLNKVPRDIHSYNASHPDFPLSPEQVKAYSEKRLVYAIMWSLVGDSNHTFRQRMSDHVRGVCTIELPSTMDGGILEYEVTLPDGEWVAWKQKVPTIEIETHRISGTDVVVPTIDTVRHEDLLYTWLSEHLPLVLCGPPGSGKTMTLFSSLRRLPDLVVAGLNFSSSSTPQLILKTFEQYCEYRRTTNGIVLAPAQLNKWLVVFCDEVNLPAMDKYHTVRVITFLRQLVEQGGFWRTSDHQWVRLERIQFVGACNPPTDPGRVPLNLRFLRHVPVVYVDYPGPESLNMIYGTFNRAVLRMQPLLGQYAKPLTDAMVDFFERTSQHFTQDMQPHYIYSPREMTRWVKGIAEAIEPLEDLSVEGLVRLWAHEALRLFQDRLVFPEEREWTDQNIDAVAQQHFPGIDHLKALQRPILYSNWLSKDYVPVELEELREYVKARLKVFYEEELDVPLVLFDEVLDHVLRIDRIFRQNQGHMLLIGVSGAGKTTLSRFVAWMNGLVVFQVKVHNQYTAKDFDEDLRYVLRRAGTRGDKMVFIMDEGNVMDTAFLERINTLLANGEVPGLFEGDEYAMLMTQCKEGSQREGLVLDGNDELYKWFSQQVMNNLHVVFTMNPAEGGLHDRAASSPALFNRCVLDWFGDWSDSARYQVAWEFLEKLDIDKAGYEAPMAFPVAYPGLSQTPSHREAVINATVAAHQQVQAAARRLAKREGRVAHITPRHFLEFINQLVRVYNEKRADLEEQQLHLNVGLQKMVSTFEEVTELQKSLDGKRKELEAKNALANEKLQQTVAAQQSAEEKKSQSEALGRELEVKQVAAQEKKESVKGELAEVEPMVLEAKNAVQGIKRQHLQELRALHNPPTTVKLALESIMCLLGERDKDWKSIRTTIVRDDFINRILEFDSQQISEETRSEMEKHYLSNSAEYNFERANRASQACGPLVKWAIAQCSYAKMLHSIEPLRNELAALEADTDRMRKQQDEVTVVVAELEKSIAVYKDEYAVLISDVQAIKTDLSSVSSKVERSIKLLDSLSSERTRWEGGAKDFDTQMATMVGDAYLGAAFLGYSGYFDQTYRRGLFSQWMSHLSKARIDFKPDIAVPEFLSTADERLRWKANSLPSDDLCTENAIMLKRYQRYPLVIDPSGQATEFLLKEFSNNKITKSSFLDPAFRKNLESALRFGTPLLVQDAEAYDPILNPVLNREVKKTGGRVLISLGDQDIDLSPAFKIILTTRNPAVTFPPDLSSRVTMVNFTVTRASLQAQCLNRVLKSERPDVEAKRTDLLKLQGEYRMRLRQLEKELLQSLNEAQGSILDDDRVIAKLEKIKHDAAEVEAKANETDTIFAEVEAVSAQYNPLAQKCAAVYFTLEQLHTVHFLYRYTLSFFLDIFRQVLSDNPNLNGVTDHTQRLEIIQKNLFEVVYERVSPGLLHEHCMPLAVTLACFHVRGTSDEIIPDEQAFLARGGRLVTEPSQFAFLVPDVLDEEQSLAAHSLATSVPAFKDLADDIRQNRDAFVTWVRSAHPETESFAASGTQNGGERDSALVRLFRELLLIQALRPDRVLSKCHTFVSAALSPSFASSAVDQSQLLAHAVEKQVDPKTPVLLCGVRGYDPSTDIADLALAMNKDKTEIALGSAEGFDQADKAITNATRTGKWVVLKNVHLAPQWLVSLEKKLLSLTPHPSFRLFLTSEIHPKLPVNITRSSRVFVYEPAPGVKANLLGTLHTFPTSRINAEPAERGRIYILLAWLHAVVQERLRYAPLGWSKKYEFGESDLRTAADTIDTWLTAEAKGRSHVDPEKIPWPALRSLLSQTIYGGRIDNEIDQRLLDSFVGHIFTPESFAADFLLVKDTGDGSSISAPEGTKREQFLAWASSLPEAQSPTWLGLPSNAEVLLLKQRAQVLAVNMLKLQTTDDDADDIAPEDDEKAQQSGTPTWMRELESLATQWRSVLPDELRAMQRSPERIKDPMFRFFDREINVGAALLSTVRHDLQNVIGCCAGTQKQTNHLRSLMADLQKGFIPKSWLRYTVPNGLSVDPWVADFALRLKQLQRIGDLASAGQSLDKARVWLGGLFNPEAYITATRQGVAQANQWSLERLRLSMDVRSSADDIPSNMANAFLLENVRLEGATCSGDQLKLCQSPVTVLPLTVLRWVLFEGDAAETKSKDRVELPVYLNATRAQVVFMASLKPVETTTQSVYARGVAMSCSGLSGLIA